MCVCEWVNVASVVRHFEWSVDWKCATEMQVHLPFTFWNLYAGSEPL